MTGLDRIRREYWPPVPVPFLSYHVMVGLGTLFIVLTLLGVSAVAGDAV